MENENKDKSGAMTKVGFVLGVIAAILAALRISFGISFILVSVIFFMWAKVSYDSQTIKTRINDAITRKENPTQYWLNLAFITFFGIVVFCLGIIALSHHM